MSERMKNWSETLDINFMSEHIVRSALIYIAQRALRAHDELKDSCNAEVFDPPYSLEQAAEYADRFRGTMIEIRRQLAYIEDTLISADKKDPLEGD